MENWRWLFRSTRLPAIRNPSSILDAVRLVSASRLAGDPTEQSACPQYLSRQWHSCSAGHATIYLAGRAVTCSCLAFAVGEQRGERWRCVSHDDKRGQTDILIFLQISSLHNVGQVSDLPAYNVAGFFRRRWHLYPAVLLDTSSSSSTWSLDSTQVTAIF